MDHRAINENPNKDQLPKRGSKWRITCDCLPKRYLLAILCFLGFLNVTTLRVNLSVALVAMVSNKTITTASGGVEHIEAAEFNWTSKDQGIILSSSFYGYVITQIPGGYLATRFGGKNIFGGGILMTALLTLLTPLAARGSMYLLIAIRALQGLCNGVTFPCMHAILSKWAPPMERSKLAAITYSGPLAGTVFGLLFSGLIADRFGWPKVFYFFGISAITWSAFWFWLVTDSPFDHPTITDKELKYLETELAKDHTEEKITKIPWKEIATSMPFWAIGVAHIAENWGYYTLLMSLPTYLKTVLHFNLEKTGFLAALPYVAMIIVVHIGGRLADYLRSRKILSTTAVRKIFNSSGFVIKAFFLLIVGYASNKDIAILELTLAVSFSGLSRNGFLVNHLDIAPRYAGLLIGITNCFAAVTGVVSPTIAGIITKNETQEEWRYVFIIASAVLLFGFLFFLIFSSGEKQPWAQPDKKEENVPLLNGKNSVTFGTSQSTEVSV